MLVTRESARESGLAFVSLCLASQYVWHYLALVPKRGT